MGKSIALAALAVLLALVACVTEDTENPVVSIVMPVNGDTLAKGDIVIKTVATDNKSVTKVEFFVDGSLVGTDNVGGAADTFRYTWSDTAAQTAGAHALGAKAYDAAENTGNATTLNICIAGGGGGTGPTYHSGKIDQDETWWPSGNPHILESDVYTGQNVTLTIKPGCVVKFDADVELYCGYSDPGSIIAVGTADSMITFTSLSDTVPGFWQSISFYSQTISTARMSYCSIEFGGKTTDKLGAVRVDQTNIKFDHNLVRKSGYSGVWVSPTGFFGDFTNNTIAGCSQYAVHIGANHVGTLGTGNSLTGNTKDAIEVDGTDVDVDATWLNHGVPYVITDDVYVDGDATLTIEAGCTIAFDPDVEFYCGYSSPGSIIAVGTAAAPITFTASTDTVPGFWQNIGFYSYTISTARLSYCNIEFGGKVSDKLGAVRVDQTSIKFDNNTIRKSGYHGVWVSPTGYFGDFTNNTITGCSQYALHIGANHVGTLGTGNTLTGNTKDGIEVDGTEIDADATWLNQGVPYVVTDDVAIDNNAEVTIEAGCTIALEPNAEFYVGYSSPGGLIAEGTPTDSITFTSSVNPPSPGDWSKLSFYSYSIDSKCRLGYCNVWYGGSDDRGNIYIDNSKPTVANCDIGYSSAYGIYLSGSEYPDPAQLRADNTFHDNADGDINK
jgi:hypothetical protein